MTVIGGPPARRAVLWGAPLGAARRRPRGTIAARPSSHGFPSTVIGTPSGKQLLRNSTFSESTHFLPPSRPRPGPAGQSSYESTVPCPRAAIILRRKRKSACFQIRAISGVGARRGRGAPPRGSRPRCFLAGWPLAPRLGLLPRFAFYLCTFLGCSETMEFDDAPMTVIG